jgi:Ca2+-binding RTX toxin-like protein
MMAKVTLKSALNDYGTFPYYFDQTTLSLNSGATATSATIEDQHGFSITFSGTHLTYLNGEATGGKVTGITFSSPSETLMTITGLNLAATKVVTDDLDRALTQMFKGNDTFNGSNDNDTIMSGLNGGDDRISGRGGNDYIIGSSGNNLIDGGAGKDTLTYEASNTLDPDGAKGGVRIDAAKGTATNPWGDKDTFSGIEVFFGTQFKDTMKGGSANEAFDGQGGNDRLTGGKGADIFHFNAGKDVITDFGNGNDVIHIFAMGIDSMEDLVIKTRHGDTTVDIGNGAVLTLLDVDKSELGASDFTFGF